MNAALRFAFARGGQTAGRLNCVVSSEDGGILAFMLLKKLLASARLQRLMAAAFIAGAFRVSAVTLSLGSALPTPAPYDIYNFAGADMDMNNVYLSGSAPATNGSANDAFTYVANDRTGQGQTFTTGASDGGYLLTDIWVGTPATRRTRLIPTRPAATALGGKWPAAAASPCASPNRRWREHPVLFWLPKLMPPPGTEGWPTVGDQFVEWRRRVAAFHTRHAGVARDEARLTVSI